MNAGSTAVRNFVVLNTRKEYRCCCGTLTSVTMSAWGDSVSGLPSIMPMISTGFPPAAMPFSTPEFACVSCHAKKNRERCEFAHENNDVRQYSSTCCSGGQPSSNPAIDQRGGRGGGGVLILSIVRAYGREPTTCFIQYLYEVTCALRERSWRQRNLDSSVPTEEPDLAFAKRLER